MILSQLIRTGKYPQIDHIGWVDINDATGEIRGVCPLINALSVILNPEDWDRLIRTERDALGVGVYMPELLAKIFPFTGPLLKCAVCSKLHSLTELVIHLADSHHMSYEQIAYHLEKVGY